MKVLIETASLTTQSNDMVSLVSGRPEPSLPEISADAMTTEDVKPILAIVSPFPPQKSGVADYVAQLLPALACYYQCVLIVPDGLSVAAAMEFPGEIIPASQFLERPDLHDRVLYQMGNSPGHLYALPLLEQVPGVVTLHDFYIGDALMYQQLIENKTNALLKALLDSHGLNVLPILEKEGLPYCASNYPCNLQVLRQADLLAIHSQHVSDLAHQFYDHIPENTFAAIPFPKGVRPEIDPACRATLRAKYGIAPEHFVVATFGFGVPTKRHDIIIQAWMESDFARDPDAHLLIVGEYASTQYLESMQNLCAGHADNIRFVGFVEESQYRECLDITDLAVQLRINSRGETSAAVMDCFASGIPVIANDHGSLKEAPDDVLWKIPDPPMASQLLTAMQYLYANPARREQIARHARHHIENHHSLAATAKAYAQALETSRVASAGAQERKQIALAKSGHLTQEQAATVAKELLFNRPRLGKRQLLIDISEVAQHDLRTGIQRVVRSTLSELLLEPPTGFEICPIYLDSTQNYRHARQFTLKQADVDCPEYVDDLVAVQAGDIYLGLDLHPTATADAAHIYRDWRAHGVRIVQVLYDLLPVQHPEWFPPIVLPEFTRWLHTIAGHSDQILAISQTVASEMEAWLSQNRDQAISPSVGWFHLGADIDSSMPTTGLPDNAPQVLEAIMAAPSFLMVSTVEPRKGHTQTLAAFEALWSRGSDANLVIVGKKGWMIEALAQKMESHPMLGKHLFWLQGISDEYLEAIYPKCLALIAASEGEGFGLPIIEAAQHQLPVIARDIPVFREVGGDGVSYFKADSPVELADALAAWLSTPDREKPDVKQVRWQTWRESAQQIRQSLMA